jgi:hypothetical protein
MTLPCQQGEITAPADRVQATLHDHTFVDEGMVTGGSSKADYALLLKALSI